MENGEWTFYFNNIVSVSVHNILHQFTTPESWLNVQRLNASTHRCHRQRHQGLHRRCRRSRRRRRSQKERHETRKAETPFARLN